MKVRRFQSHVMPFLLTFCIEIVKRSVSEDRKSSTHKGSAPLCQNFEFVNATDSDRPNASAREMVRSHVMREVNRVSSMQKLASSSAASRVSGGGPKKQTQRFRLGIAGLREIPPTTRSRWKKLLQETGTEVPSVDSVSILRESEDININLMLVTHKPGADNSITSCRDPFNSLPVPNSPRLEFILHQCKPLL
jgi:hypothetical protein